MSSNLMKPTECAVCHKLRMDSTAKAHEWINCPKKADYLKKLDLMFSWCHLCCDWTKYHTEYDYVCLGQCEKRNKHQDLTINDNRGQNSKNSYMIKNKKIRKSYEPYKKN